MKRKLTTLICVVLAILTACAVFVAGCGGTPENTEPKEYTVVLDYQGAPVAGNRQFTVTEGESLPELPKNLVIEHKEFLGWYTQENCGGTRVADKYGLIPVVSVLNANNFDLSGDYIYLYAGFEDVKHTVTLCFEEGIDTEKVTVVYDTPVSEVVATTRVNGNAVLSWSKTKDGEVWNGRITDDIVLFAKEYAPVIELEVSGGNGVNPIIARAGASITLPTPTKSLSKFLYWADESGAEYTAAVMPSESISLRAVWQAKLVFDSNGGNSVNDISLEAGAQVTLPTPARDGFIFAGWYTTDRDPYTSSTMPSAGVALKAGWYKEKNQKIIIITSEKKTSNPKSICAGQSKGPSADWRKTLDLSEYIPVEGAEVRLAVNAKMKFDVNAIGAGGFYFYDDVIVSESNFLDKWTDTVAGTSYKNYSFNMNFTLRTNTLYICYYAKVTEDISGSMWKYLCISDFWLTLYYPDTANLYL